MDFIFGGIMSNRESLIYNFDGFLEARAALEKANTLKIIEVTGEVDEVLVVDRWPEIFWAQNDYIFTDTQQGPSEALYRFSGDVDLNRIAHRLSLYAALELEGDLGLVSFGNSWRQEGEYFYEVDTNVALCSGAHVGIDLLNALNLKVNEDIQMYKVLM
jgi:hypothetical protein